MSNASPDPALAVASKRIVALEADITNLRKGMVQQLTLSGKLIKAVFALDDDYFGGRFQAQQNQDSPDPFRDFTVATKVVEAVSEELQGGSAFADSPVLRDGIANLITALESSRGIAAEMEKSGIEAVGLPVKPVAMKARVFPENNPPGCLAESAGSVHDLAAMMGRTRDRFNAMRMMMNEAERARAEAESVVTPVNVEKVAASVTEELKKVQNELKTTRAQLMATLDSHAQKEKSLRAELDRARREAAYEVDVRISDRAEARSLAAEIARQIEQAMPKGLSDDLEITLSVLREALNEDQDIAALAAATEGVVVDWVRLTSDQVGKPTAALVTKADDGRLAAEKAALEKELAVAKSAAAQASSATAEATRLKEKLVEVERRAATAEQDLVIQKGRADQAAAGQSAELTALKVKVAETEAALATRERELASVKAAAATAQRKATDTQAQLDAAAKTAQQGVDSTNRDVTALRAQLSQSTTALRLKEDEAKRAKEALQQEQTKNGDALQNLTRQLHAAQEKLAVTTSEIQGERSKAADAARQLADTQARATLGREQELKILRDTHSRELRQAIDAKVIAETRAQQLEATAKQTDAARANELAEARKTISTLEARVTESQSKAETVSAELTRLKGEVGRIGVEHAKATASLEFATARERQLGVDRERLERERSEAQARLDALRKSNDATIVLSEQNLGTLKKQLAEAQAVEGELRSQLARLSSEAKAHGEKHRKTDQDLVSLRSEKERVASSIQTLSQERDQARLKLSEIERERARSTETHAKTEAQVRTLTAELAALKRVEQETTVRAEKLTAELAQLRERLTASQQSAAQATAQQLSLKDVETRLSGERDAAKTAATNAGAERDRLKAQLDRLQSDHDTLGKAAQEREAQLNARLADVSRQLGDLKQTNSRLAAEGERIQAEATRAASASAHAREALDRKESTSVWTKRLSDSSAQIDQARAKTNELERKIEEQRTQLAQFEEKLARQTQAEVHLRERVGEVERRESAAQQQLSAAKAEVDQARARLAGLEQDLAAAKSAFEEAEARRERQKVRFDALMREAREAVASAARRQEQLESEGNGKATVIADLMKQLQDLRLRTSTNS